MTLTLKVWDVQHGSAALIQTPNGKNIVVDLGVGSYSNRDEIFSPLKYIKEEMKIDQLDWVIITHPHKDHIDDILNFDLLKPKLLTRPKVTDKIEWSKIQPSDKKIFEKYDEIDKRYTSPVSDQENLTNPKNTDGVKFSTYIPSGPFSDLNDYSVVTVITYENNKILIPGDNGEASWKNLLLRTSFVEEIRDTNLFLASHHGRENGYFSQLFVNFKPELIIISDGPSTDTSAVDSYSRISTGKYVISKSNSVIKRSCVTTRQDGVITITIDKDSEAGKTKSFIWIK